MSTSAYFHKNIERSLIYINFYHNVTHELLIQYNAYHSQTAQLKERKKSSHIRNIITENRLIHKLQTFKTVSLKVSYAKRNFYNKQKSKTWKRNTDN